MIRITLANLIIYILKKSLILLVIAPEVLNLHLNIAGWSSGSSLGS